MSDAPPATPDEADAALMKKEEYRTPSLDGYAQVYQAATGLRALFDQYSEQAGAPAERHGEGRPLLELDAYIGALREHVAEEHPVAVRETLAFDRAPDL